jgi:hypothetical protein
MNMNELFSQIAGLLNMLAANKILLQNITSWGERKVYHATINELIVLLTGGAEAIELNHDEGDGSFSHRLNFRGHTFMQSTNEVIDFN